MSDGRSVSRPWSAGAVNPKKVLFLGVVLTLGVVASHLALDVGSDAAMHSQVDTESHVRWLSTEVMRLDEVLTMSARMAAATGDSQWENRYWQHAPEFVARTKELTELTPDDYASASATHEAHHRLVEMELRSFELRRAGDGPAALALLQSTDYQLQQRIYDSGIARSNENALLRTSKLHAAHRRTTNATVAVGLVVCGVLLSLWAHIGKALMRYTVALDSAGQELANANLCLESRVEERTAALSAAHELLKQEMARRLEMERELRQAQKLKAVGCLAAGVAHEINTPMQFVSDSIYFVRDAVKDLVGVVEKLSAVRRCVLDGTPSQDAATEAAEAEEAADLPYLLEHLPAALDRALDGVGRVTTIVRAMKEFAHPDQKEMIAVDLNQAI